MTPCYVSLRNFIEVIMFEALLTVVEAEVELSPVADAIDVYEGSIPPAATFQVIDVDPSVVRSAIANEEDDPRAN